MSPDQHGADRRDGHGERWGSGTHGEDDHRRFLRDPIDPVTGLSTSADKNYISATAILNKQSVALKPVTKDSSSDTTTGGDPLPT